MATARPALIWRRKQLDLTQEQVAFTLDVSTTTWRNWESGATSPRPGQRPAIARVLKITLAEAHRMIDGDGDINGHAVPVWLSHLASLEHAASYVWAYQPIAMHGLLHTPGYTAAIERMDRNVRTAEAVERRVELRQRRQQVLSRAPDPLGLSVILDESVLHRVAGDRRVMSIQLDHLVEVAQLANVDLRVIPLNAGVFASAFGAFTLIAREGKDPYMAVTEDRCGAHYLDREPEVAAHTALFDDLVNYALSPVETVNLIDATNKEHYR